MSAKAIGYFTSQYPRASDTFIRTEVQRLRELGVDVQTFAIRRPPAAALVSDAIRSEFEKTTYLLDSSKLVLMLNCIWLFLSRPILFLRTLKLSIKTGIPGIGGRVKSLAYFIEAATLARYLKSRSLLHLHNHIGENSATVAMLASSMSGVPFSLTIHGPGIFYNARHWALGEKIVRSTFTATISHFCRSQCMVFAPYAAWHKIGIVRCCVEKSFLAQPPTPVGAQNRLVFVGRLVEEKGVVLLIEVASRLRQVVPEFGISIIGDGPMRAEMERLVQEYGLAEHVQFLGFRSSAEVAEELTGSKGLILPSFAEGLPVVIMESLALGRPVITTRIAGIPELVDEKCGWIVDPGDVDALHAAAKESLLAEPEVLTRMGEHGRRRVELLHNSDTALEPLLARLSASIGGF